ncbi:MAG: reverse transcriptase/maturase family protein [Spirochaetia bacterium]|nr:reverse transcriptase/maturase family protein [Spirochaetia bacterium]
MPKTYNNLFQSIVSWENLLAAYHEARSGKRYRGQVLSFSEHIEENLIQIQNELIWRMWKPLDPRHFVVREPKVRPISAPVFYDRVVHHALVRIIEPLFERKFINRSCACRVGKGTGFVLREVKQMVRSRSNSFPKNKYVLKADIKSYFPSIAHDVLKTQYRRTIRCRNTLWLMDTIVDSGMIGNRGLPIGYLTSQLYANIYLDQLDHFITDELGIGQYIRYMDDFLIFSDDKDWLKHIRDVIEEYLNSVLLLDLNPKTQVIPISHGVDYCGYRIFRDKVFPRKRNVKRAKRRLKKLARRPVNMEQYKATLMSFLGYMKHCNGYQTTCSVLDAAKIGGDNDT